MDNSRVSMSMTHTEGFVGTITHLSEEWLGNVSTGLEVEPSGFMDSVSFSIDPSCFHRQYEEPSIECLDLSEGTIGAQSVAGISQTLMTSSSSDGSTPHFPGEAEC